MTRQLVDVRNARHYLIFGGDEPVNDLVASLLTEGPAEHTILCPTCEGRGEHYPLNHGHPHDCAACKGDGRQTVIVRAEVAGERATA